MSYNDYKETLMISAFVLCACDMYKVIVKVSENICDKGKFSLGIGKL